MATVRKYFIIEPEDSTHQFRIELSRAALTNIAVYNDLAIADEEAGDTALDMYLAAARLKCDEAKAAVQKAVDLLENVAQMQSAIPDFGDYHTYMQDNAINPDAVSTADAVLNAARDDTNHKWNPAFAWAEDLRKPIATNPNFQKELKVLACAAIWLWQAAEATDVVMYQVNMAIALVIEAHIAEITPVRNELAPLTDALFTMDTQLPIDKWRKDNEQTAKGQTADAKHIMTTMAAEITRVDAIVTAIAEGVAPEASAEAAEMRIALAQLETTAASTNMRHADQQVAIARIMTAGSIAAKALLEANKLAVAVKAAADDATRAAGNCSASENLTYKKTEHNKADSAARTVRRDMTRLLELQLQYPSRSEKRAKTGSLTGLLTVLRV